ncbi:NAD+ synthase [Arcticibacter eurypsychrophilus]|uniref:NAD+ synthase n=1 Tax=Arcticibacter eurypsychrophilus TaxID=1434752 RepID=UPI00084CEF77|nr:NAD+ synthase [Arcticibacter eurypsychrophilus]
MKIALAQLNYHIGNFESNTSKIIQAINKAKAEGADLVVFAELAVCGYPPRDFLEFTEFIDLCEEAINTIAEVCTDIVCIVGVPSKNPAHEGKDLFNSAYVIQDGKVVQQVHKALLPNYDVFDEYRYFEPGLSNFNCIEVKGTPIALTICEDLWNINDNPLYLMSPMDELIKQKPALMLNIAASPFSYVHDDNRVKVLSDNCKKYNLPLLYINQVGAQTEIIFDGGSFAFDKEGVLLDQMNYFKEDFRIYDFNNGKINGLDPIAYKPLPDIEQIHHGLILGIRDYFYKSGFSKAVLGLSGGIDSAVVCALAAEALGPENVMAVLMPSKYSTDHSVKDAMDLVKNLGCKHQIIAIKDAADAFEGMLETAFKGLPFNTTEENIQARCRAIVVMAFSNKFGFILLNTSNKSECAVGYGTLYGDMAGAISVLGDVYKTQVFTLANYINREREIIPNNSIIKPPSAELRPGQKDSDSLPDYEVLDSLLYQYIELKKSSKAIIAQGFDPEMVKKVLKMVNTAEFKRYQTAPILRVSPKAFGMGRRMPLVGKYLS